MSQLSNGYSRDAQVSTRVRSYGRNENIFKIPYGIEKYVIVPLLQNENELF